MDRSLNAGENLALDSTSYTIIEQSGLFDLAWYCAAYKADPATALSYWAQTGWRQGQKPNFYFDTNWYLTYYADVRSSGKNPLLHYIQFGEHEGRYPSELFDPAWYRETFLVASDELCLAHYLRERLSGRVNPNPDFDADFYLATYADIAASGIDPFIHFMELGFREDRDPSADFDTGFYRARYLRGQPGVNPLLDYQRRRGETGVFPKRPVTEATIPGEIARFSRPGEAFEPFEPLPAGTPLRVRALAYYLPQYHHMPENDAWWGRGFTEWTNLSRGVPRFSGHYQPRTPRDLGHYTLDNPEILRRQIDMAQAAGLAGFIFYFYWFNGHRLMEKPLEILLADRSLDMPFCLMWANENWTRRWDGHDNEILISQDYRSSEDEELILTFGRHFADPRYIRLEGRPVLMIYRPALIPDVQDKIAHWRRLFRDLCQEDPILIMGQGFDALDPGEFGLDAAIEFPPHKLTAGLFRMNEHLEWLDMEAQSHVLSYQDTIAASLAEAPPPFPLIKTAVPSWDNDARREGRGLLLHGSTPAAFGEWVSALVQRAEENPVFGEPIICINAWNEWAEGAYLEPDVHFGAAYLNAFSRAVSAETLGIADGKILLVGHDGHRHGAQTLLLAIGRAFKRLHGLSVEFLLLEGGPMVPDYDAVAPVTVLARLADLAVEAHKFAARGFRHAIVNTVAAGGACRVLSDSGLATVLLVHELPNLIREKNLTQLARRGLLSARQIVFPAASVRDDVLRHLSRDGEDFRPKTLIRPQGIYQTVPFDMALRAKTRKALGIPAKAPLLIGIGYADMRKGFDLFLQFWEHLQAVAPHMHLAWAGNMDRALASYFEPEIARAKASAHFHLLGFRNDINTLLPAADVFILTSREDPFPSTVLEALSVGIPTVAFAGSGGIPDLIAAHDAGHVVPRGDVAAMAQAAVGLAGVTAADARTRRARLAAIADSDFDFRHYTQTLVDLADPGLLCLSVAIPNYNYAHHLRRRLETIFQQWSPLREIVLLDDHSTDDSVVVAETVAAEADRAITIITNQKNSGSVFAQWRRAAEAVTGEFVWIAEADDESDPRFLSHLLRRMMADPNIVLAFSDSSAIGQDGTILSDSYKTYYNSAAPGVLEVDTDFAGRDFLRRCLSERNLILNVSSVLWRRSALLAALDRCGEKLHDFRVAGDWYLYADILSQPDARIAYSATPLNYHRRHQSSVTHTLDGRRHVSEIAEVQNFIATRLNLDSKLRKKQKIYLNDVTKQLIGH